MIVKMLVVRETRTLVNDHRAVIRKKINQQDKDLVAAVRQDMATLELKNVAVFKETKTANVK